jgi:hypothetical protein
MRRRPQPVHADQNPFVPLQGHVDGDARNPVVRDDRPRRQHERRRAEPAGRARQVEAPVGRGDELEDHTMRGIEHLEQAHAPGRRLTTPETDHVVNQHRPVRGTIAEVE